MKFTEFIKKELSGWKSYEIIGLALIFCLISYNYFVLRDSLAAVFSALFGILYTAIAGKGKLSCYFFGLLGSGCYVYLAMVNHLWGNACLYLLYYIPMQVHGIFEWKKHIEKQTNEIEKVKLQKSDRLKLAIYGVFGCVATYIILIMLNDKSPLFDAITTFLSILGMYLTVKRLVEQWFIWMIVNGLSFLMWVNLVFNHGAKTFSTLVMWGFYFVMAIYFYIVWRKELKRNNYTSCQKSDINL